MAFGVWPCLTVARLQLFPPLTFMQPTGAEQVIQYGGIKLTVVEVTTTLP